MAIDKEKRYAEIVRQRYNKARDLFEPVADRVEVNRNLYKGYIDTSDNYEWDYSLVDQQVFPLIRNYISRSNPAMTKVRLEARTQADFERRKINQDFLNWEINELPLSTLLTRAFFSNYIAGKAYFKTGWKYDPRVVIKNGKYEYVMRPLVNRADLQFVPFNRLLVPNRNIPNLKDQPYVMETVQLRIGDMIKDNETYGYEYWDKSFIEKLRKSDVHSKKLDYEAEFVIDSDTKDEMAFQAATFPAVCMHTKEGDVIYIPLVDDMDKIINKKRENTYWHGHYPYIDMTAFPEDDEYYSMSVVDAVGDNQIAATEILNQMLTNVRSLNNNMWIAGAPAATTPDWMFKQRPSGIIRTNGDPALVQPIRPNDATTSILRVSQELNTKFERTGGISSLYSSGSANTQSVNQTARGAQIIDQNIETNIRMIVDLFGEQVLKEIGNHFLELNPQYVTEEQTFAVTGKKNVRELISIKPEEISANFDVYTMAEAMIKQTPASRQASLQNTITTLQAIQVQSQGAVQVDLTPVVEALIDATPDMENVEDVVVSVDEKGERDAAMLERGQMPEIKVRDPHMDLIQIVSMKFEDNQDTYSPEIQAIFQEYVEKHLRYIQSEKEVQAMAAPQIPQAQDPNAMAAMMGGEVPITEGIQEGLPDAGYDLGTIV